METFFATSVHDISIGFEHERENESESDNIYLHAGYDFGDHDYEYDRSFLNELHGGLLNDVESEFDHGGNDHDEFDHRASDQNGSAEVIFDLGYYGDVDFHFNGFDGGSDREFEQYDQEFRLEFQMKHDLQQLEQMERVQHIDGGEEFSYEMLREKMAHAELDDAIFVKPRAFAFFNYSLKDICWWHCYVFTLKSFANYLFLVKKQKQHEGARGHLGEYADFMEHDFDAQLAAYLLFKICQLRN